MSALSPSVIVDLFSSAPSVQTLLAVQVCTGLQNRDDYFNSSTSYGGVFTIQDDYDVQWLRDLYGIVDPSTLPVDTFLAQCMSDTAVKGYILYDYSIQQALVPNLITLAGVLDAIPLEASMVDAYNGYKMAFDATVQWNGYSPLNATQYMYDKYADQTTTMAIMNPGYDNAVNPSDPPLTQSPNLKLTDYIVKAKLFNFYLNDACIKGTDEYELMLKMTQYNPWPR